MLVDWMMAVLRFASVATVCPPVVPRDSWGARAPKYALEEMHSPVNFVVLHHTYQPAYCSSFELCSKAMRSMQSYHQDSQGWADIGYNFAVGGDGRVYTGRGWHRVGAHAPPYNYDSIGITLIGDWRAEAPPQEMLDAAQWLIRCGVESGRIAPDYQLIGHLQAKPKHTECPGAAFQETIKTWDHWVEKPGTPFRPTAAAVAPATNSLVPELPAEGAVVAEAIITEDIVTASPSTPPPLTSLAPAAAAGVYNPLTPDAERDAVEVRPLGKRSLWDRLVRIWQLEAERLARLEDEKGMGLQDLQQPAGDAS